MGTTLEVIAILTIMVLLKTPQTMANSEDFGSSPVLKCDVKHRIMEKSNFDKKGRRCWDMVDIAGCEGYCNSYAGVYELLDLELANFQSDPFPHHPVCIHKEQREVEVILSKCEKNADNETRMYKYTEAVECTCSVCDSSKVSCESYRKRGGPEHPAIPETRDFYDDSVTSLENTREWRWPQLLIPQVLQLPAYP